MPVALTVLGFALCGFVLWHNHRDQNRDRTFVSILRGFSLRSYKCQWQLRLAFGVSLLLALFSTLDMTRFMWAGFACGSLLADVEVESHIHEKLRDRLLGAVIGSVAFWLIWSVLPVNLEPLLGRWAACVWGSVPNTATRRCSTASAPWRWQRACTDSRALCCSGSS